MESRVMGNCHARFGAGENLEERICSLRLHIPPKGLPIAILHNGCGGYGGQATRIVQQAYVCGPEPPHGAVGIGVSAAVPVRKHPRGHEEGL